MDFLRREKAVLGFLARGLAVVGKALFAGQGRRRITLAGAVSIGLIGYLWGRWGLDALLESLLEIIFGVPAPGQPLAPATWLSPTNGLWPDVMLLSRVAMGLSSVLLLGLLGRATMATDTAGRRAEIKRVGRAGLMMGATWTIIPFGLHLSNEIATGLAPNHDALLDAVAATAGGTLALGVVTWLQPLFVAVGVIATIVLRGIIFVGFVAWPIAWPLRAFDTDLSRTLGRSITALFTVAVVAKLVQALGAFLVVFLSITIEATVVRVLVFVVGTIAVFVALPIVMVRHAERVMMLPGSLAPTEQQVGQYVDESAARVGQIHKQLEDKAHRINEWRTLSESREAVQTRLNEWDEETNNDSGDGWFTHEFSSTSPSVSAEWERSSTSATMSDGVYGPTSHSPNDGVQDSQNARTTREQGRRDDP